MLRGARVAIVALVAGAALPPLLAQSAGQPVFEVASVKHNTSGEARWFGPVISPGGRYTFTNVALRQIVRSAYAEGQSSLLENFRLVGGPDWLDADRFDIQAKAPGASPTRAEYRAMMQTLLRDRFKVAVHWETRSLPMYALIMANADGRLGPRFHKTAIDCAPIFAGAAGPETQPGQMPPCGTIQSGPGRMTARGRTLDMLATDLSERVERPIENRTRLQGYFDADMEWTPTDVPADSSGPSIFTALQEQLGLKLESTRGPVRVLLIDHAEQPSAD
jgi:uncharacterized protein (TIGR03435 family)